MGLLGEIADFGEGVIGNNLTWTERATAAESPILVAGQQAIESMKHSTGVGDPESGQRFGAGADQMGAAGQVLVSAFPDDSWNSSGASAYADRNSEQIGRVQTMLGLDHLVAGVLSTEAGQIAATRDSLDGHADWLDAMSLLTTSTGIGPGFGAAARMTAEFAMVARAVGDSNDDLTTLCGNIDENAAALQTAAAQYQALAGDTPPTGAQVDPPAGDPQVRTAPEDREAIDPDGPTSDVPSGGGVPSGSQGPASGGAVRSALSSTPSMSTGMPTGMPGAGPAAPDAAANAAGALGGILGSLVSPISGFLAGFTQAIGQAAQLAGQAATQLAGQTGGPAVDIAQLDKDDAERDGRGEDGADDEKDEHDQDRTKDGRDGEAAKGQVAGPSAQDSADAPAKPLGAGADDEAAKTLPPDLEAAAAGGAAAGPAPVHVGADFEQGELRVAAAATLDRGAPGSDRQLRIREQ